MCKIHEIYKRIRILYVNKSNTNFNKLLIVHLLNHSVVDKPKATHLKENWTVTKLLKKKDF